MTKYIFAILREALGGELPIDTIRTLYSNLFHLTGIVFHFFETANNVDCNSMKKSILAIVISLFSFAASAADRDAIKFTQHVMGPEVSQEDLEGKILVVHLWQAH